MRIGTTVAALIGQGFGQHDEFCGTAALPDQTSLLQNLQTTKNVVIQAVGQHQTSADSAEHPHTRCKNDDTRLFTKEVTYKHGRGKGECLKECQQTEGCLHFSVGNDKKGQHWKVATVECHGCTTLENGNVAGSSDSSSDGYHLTPDDVQAAEDPKWRQWLAAGNEDARINLCNGTGWSEWDWQYSGLGPRSDCAKHRHKIGPPYYASFCHKVWEHTKGHPKDSKWSPSYFCPCQKLIEQNGVQRIREKGCDPVGIFSL